MTTFLSVDKYLKQIKNYGSGFESCFVLGNFIDCENRAVSENAGKDLQNRCKIKFFESSAKTGENIEKILNAVIKQVLKKVPRERITSLQLDEGRASLPIKDVDNCC